MDVGGTLNSAPPPELNTASRAPSLGIADAKIALRTISSIIDAVTARKSTSPMRTVVLGDQIQVMNLVADNVSFRPGSGKRSWRTIRYSDQKWQSSTSTYFASTISFSLFGIDHESVAGQRSALER